MGWKVSRLMFALAGMMLLGAGMAQGLQPPRDKAGDTGKLTAKAEADESEQRVQLFLSLIDPSRKRWLWILPPNVSTNGVEPIKVTVSHLGKIKLSTEIPVRAQILGPADRKEIPEGHTGVLLVEAGLARERVAEVDRAIHDIIAQYGRGQSEVEFQNFAPVALNEAAKRKYCDDGDQLVFGLFIDEIGVEALREMDKSLGMEMSIRALEQACADWNGTMSPAKGKSSN